MILYLLYRNISKKRIPYLDKNLHYIDFLFKPYFPQKKRSSKRKNPHFLLLENDFFGKNKI